MGIDIDNAIRVACSDANAQFVAMNLADDTIEIISKHYAHSFAEYRAAAMEVVGKSFEQLGNNQNYLSLSDSF